MSRWLNILLVVATLGGVVMGIRERDRHRKLHRRHAELAAEYGDMTIGDPQKIHIIALRSDDPLVFRWRIFMPAGYNAQWRAGGVNDRSTSTNRSGSERNYIAQIRFRKNSRGYVKVCCQNDMGSSDSPVGGPGLCEFLADRWDELTFDQLGDDGVVVLDPEEVVTLLQIQMPDGVAEEARSNLEKSYDREHVPLVYHCRVGTPEAHAAEEAKRAGDSVEP